MSLGLAVVASGVRTLRRELEKNEDNVPVPYLSKMKLSAAFYLVFFADSGLYTLVSQTNREVT